MNARPVIAITTGEPAGIGPEISLAAAATLASKHPGITTVLLGDAAMLVERAARAGLRLDIVEWRSEHGDRLRSGGEAAAIAVIDHRLAVACIPGVLDPRNGRYVLSLIDAAIAGAVEKRFDAIVTAPVQKSTINDAGIAFTGHTEYLAEKTGTARVVMMLAGDTRTGGEAGGASAMLRVALATTHLALADVPGAISTANLVETLTILDRDLRGKFGIARPRILVTGLNPHAGEGGYLGREEIDVIAPAIEAARALGIDARGPFPADTLFQPRYLDQCDAVLAMYHDQGLPVLKYATFGRGVNITLGLPIIRTSVDHGTALDLAGDPGKAAKIDAGSMIAAVELAAEMVKSKAP